MRFKICFLVLSVVCLMPIVADTATDADADRFIDALVLLEQGAEDEALESFEEFLLIYPDSRYAAKAAEYADRLARRIDQGGIFTFYLGNLATMGYIGMFAPFVFGYDEDAVLPAVTGIAGITAGVATSYLMTRNDPIPLALDLWMTTVQGISLTSFEYLYSALVLEDDSTINPLLGSLPVSPGDMTEEMLEQLDHEQNLKERLNIAGTMLTALGSRAAVYYAGRNRDLSADNAFFTALCYGWSQYYYWLTVNALLDEDQRSPWYRVLGTAVTGGAAAGGYYLNTQLEWSLQRSGVVTVGGLAGMTIGFLANAIIAETVEDFDPWMINATVMTGSALGKAAAVFLTGGNSGNVEAFLSLGSDRMAGTDASAGTLALLPVAGAEGFGFQGTYRY